jgi:hypothetical protein
MVTSGMVAIILAATDTPGGFAMCLSGFVIDILVLIFMKIVDKKNYIYIPNYLR